MPWPGTIRHSSARRKSARQPTACRATPRSRCWNSRPESRPHFETTSGTSASNAARAISWARLTRDRTRAASDPILSAQDTVRLPCSDFCGICHELEAEEHATQYLASSSANQHSCAQCHMPTCRERLTQGHILSYIHPKRAVHDHAFPVWSPIVSAGAVEIGRPAVTCVEGRPMEVTFALTNRGAGHRIPTGDYGHRKLRVAVELLDRGGRMLGQAEQAVFPGQDLSLAPGAPTSFRLLVAATANEPAERIRVVVQRVNQARSFQYTLAEGEWPISP